QLELGRRGHLVGRSDAGEVADRAAAGLAIEALDVTPRALGEARVDEDVDEQCSELGDAAHVLGAVLAAEREVAAEAMAHVVAVETIGPAALADQPLL